MVFFPTNSSHSPTVVATNRNQAFGTPEMAEKGRERKVSYHHLIQGEHDKTNARIRNPAFISNCSLLVAHHRVR